MKAKGKIEAFTPENGEIILSFSLEGKEIKGELAVAVNVERYHDLEELENMVNKRDTVYEINIEPYRAKRSNDANAYMWVLCNKIAMKIGQNITKEDVYRKAIREVGVFEILPLKVEAIDRFIHTWSDNGVGWFCDKLGKTKNFEGYENVICYYGSSTYNTKEMSVLINNLVEDAKERGIETMPPKELESLLASWEKKK